MTKVREPLHHGQCSGLRHVREDGSQDWLGEP
jgi:hypothetical protein